VHLPDPGSLADGAHPAVGGAPVKALTVMAQQDGTISPFTDSEVDCSGGTRHQRNEGGLVSLADDPQYPVASLEGHVLDVGVAGFAHPQAIQSQQHSQRSMSVVESFGGEEKLTQLASVHPSPLGGMHGGTADILGRVSADPAVDVSEAVVTHAVDRRRSIVDAARPRSSIEVRYSSR
jgi:hypothetical protein